jgi:hypothetical protein
MSDAARAFHREWLGMAQPIEGLVLSIPALIEADCFSRQPAEKHREFVALLRELPGTDAASPERSLSQPREFFRHTLGWDHAGYTEELPEGLSLYIPEGHQTLRPTAALKLPDYAKKSTPPRASRPSFTPAAQLGERYRLLYWELPEALPLDKPETITGPWEYPPAHKFDRLLRECRVPVGVLCNQRVVRLIYAPHGEASGHIDFRISDMAQVHGRPLYDALVMLLGQERIAAVAPDRQLHAMLARSRQMQAEVTTELAKQLYRALETLLAAFDAADRRTQSAWLGPILGALASDSGSATAAASSDDNDELYQALLTLLLRLVVLLYAEDSSLLPTDHPLYAQYYSLYALFERLEDERGRFPDAMHRRYSAYPGLLALFRALYYGVQHGDFVMASHQGALFDPNRFAFLEGFDSKSAVPVGDAESRAAAQVPTIDDESIYQVLHALIYLGGERLSYKSLQVEQIGSVYEALMGYRTVRQDGRLVLVPGKERERTSSHYTPQALSRPLVSRALEPLLCAFAAKSKDGFVSSEQILSLSVCDPAMGSGAFLVEATRILAEQLLAAWQREGHPLLKAVEKGDALQEAQRLIVERCIYGVDKNPFAVELAKISLWLLTMQRGRPFSFVDHNLRCGDSLVGLSFEQITSFHWQPTAQQNLIQDELKSMLDEAIQARLRITRDAAQSYAKKHAAMADADDALYRLRLIANVVLGAFFKETKAKARETERLRRLDLITRWLSAPDNDPDIERELKALSQDVEARLRPLHWHLEFPEIFYAGRIDPFTQEQTSEPAYLDCIIGNPPFGGKNNIAANHADGYVDWLKTLHDGAHGNADLCAHFFRRADALLGQHGTTGLIATNTIAQGDTRASSLQYLVNQGARIFNAEVSRPWPGAAAVTISTVHLAKGEPAAHVGQCLLDDAEVPVINSRLRPAPERPDPVTLADNEGCSFVGTYVLGMGFMLTPEEREALIAKDQRNAERIFPYLGGEEVNTSPTQMFDRYVISFGQMSLEEAEAWPDLIQIVRDKVKPDRDKNKREVRRKYWWRFGEAAPALYAAIAPLHCCLVTSIHSKHLLFAFQPIDTIFSHALYVFTLDRFSPFAVLQSRIHERWARLLSSSMKTDLRYAATDCFGTFPFPAPNPRTVIPELEARGETLYQRRADWMQKHNLGLTKLYNALKDPHITDTSILELRKLHTDLDSAVLHAYATHTCDPTWITPDIPPYTDPQTPAQRLLHTTFENHILDHLFTLNTQRSHK